MNENYLEQAAPRKGYTLGPMAYYITRQGPYRKDIVKVAEPLAAFLAKELQLQVVVTSLRHYQNFVLCTVDGSRELKVGHGLFFIDSLYKTASGRVLFAHLTPEQQATYITQQGLPNGVWLEVKTEKGLYRALTQIRKRGIAFNNDYSDVVQIAFPIQEKERVIAALALSVPRVGFQGNYKKKVFREMKKTAETIGVQLSSPLSAGKEA